MEDVDKNELLLLEAYFEGLVLPETIRLAPGTTVSNVRKFIAAQFAVIRGDNNWPVRRPAYERLLLLKAILENGGSIEKK